MPEPTFIEMPDGSLAVEGDGNFMEYDYDALVECCCGPSGHNCEHYFWADWDPETESWTIYEKTAPGCIAGSITRDELADLWATGVDVICVRGAACAPDKGEGRFGKVKAEIIRELVATIPKRK